MPVHNETDLQFFVNRGPKRFAEVVTFSWRAADFLLCFPPSSKVILVWETRNWISSHRFRKPQSRLRMEDNEMGPSREPRVV